MTDSDYADNLALLAKIPARVESLPRNLKQTAGDIGLYMNTNKTEFMYFKQDGSISALNGKPLKLVDQFTYLRKNISSTERDISTCIDQARTANDRLSIL